MIYGLFLWFIFGFLMTALPKWMQVSAIESRGYLGPFVFLSAAWVLYYLALVWPALMGVALTLAGLGWFWGGLVLYRVVASSRTDKRHGYGVVGAVFLGLLGLVVYGMALVFYDGRWFALAVQVGIWWFVAPVFFIVLHRMLPFFSASVIPNYRSYAPMWALGAMLLAFFLHGLLMAIGLPEWVWVVDGPAAVLALHFSARWGLLSSLVNPMLAVLHLAGLWLGVALSMLAVQSFLAFLGVAWGGLWPLHALILGCFVSLMIGMGTRVTRGHSGMVISEDKKAWPVFWVFQGVVALRGAGEFHGAGAYLHPFVLSAALWLMVFAYWAWHYMPLYFRPRQDGQPG